MHGYNVRQLVESFIRELSQEEFIAMLQAAALWGLCGVIMGAVFSYTSYRGFRRLRWYDATSTAGRWLQRSVLLVTLVACGALFGAAGLWEGVRQQCHSVVLRSRIGTDALPVASNLLAEVVVWIDVGLQHDGSLGATGEDPRITAFKEGTWDLDAPAFLQRVSSARQEIFQPLLQQLERMILAKSPALQGGLTGQILHETVQELGPVLLDRKLSNELRRRGLDHVQAALRDQLVAEAARTGNPATISYRDLSAFILREGLVPAIATPVRSFGRQQQVLYILGALLFCVSPAVLARIFRPRAKPPVISSSATAG